MSTNKHITTDLTTANINEAKKAQEWVRGNQSVKIGSKTVAGILSEVRTLISGTLNLAEKPGKLSNTQTDAIIAKIQEDAFAKKYIEKQLNHENNRTKKNVLEALDMYYEVRAYLGLVSYMSSALESHGKKCEKAKTAFAAGDTSSIPQKHKSDFQEWKKELEKEKAKLETSFSMLPKVGQDRLNANYAQWQSDSDLSAITGTPPPTPTHTPPTNPNILSSQNITITSLPHSEKIQGSINAGETLLMTRDGVTWTSVSTDSSNNFNIPVTETANGNYIYRLKTKNAAGVDSGEETVIVDINVVVPAVAPTQPNITSGTSFSVNTPTIEGNTTPGSEVEIYEGANKIGDGIADASGHFSITTSPLADGTHGIKVEAFNPADRTKKSHENQSITIDTLSNKAETAVVAAENASPKTQKLHDDAVALVAPLPTSANKTDLEKRLQIVQDEIDMVAELNKSLNFTKPLEIEQGVDDPEFEVDNAINGEELLFSYPSENPNSISRTKGRGYKDASFLATGSDCDITLEQLKTDKARTINVFIRRRKNGIEGQETMVKIKIKPAPILPEKPDDLTDVITLKGTNKEKIKGTLKDPSHTIIVLDASKNVVSGISPSIDPTTGEFDFDVTADQLNMSYNGEEDFYIRIRNAKGDIKDCRIKAKITGRKHKVDTLEQPDFELPNKEFTQGEECVFPIKLNNASLGSEVEIEIENASGLSVQKKTRIQVKNNGRITLNQLGKFKFADDGEHTVKITYKDPDPANPANTTTESISFDVKKAPKPVDLGAPEGIPETIDVTSEPFNISGKLRDKSHSVELLNDAGGSFTPQIKPVVKDDGTFSMQLPKFGAGDHTAKYKIRVSDNSGRTPPMIPVDMNITANKKMPPKSNMWIIENEHDFVHKCEHVKEHPSHPEHFFINGKGQFDIEYKKKGMYGLRKDVFIAKNIPTSSGIGGSTKNIEANSPEELYEKVQEHLKQVNTKEKNEYNARWGLAPEPTNENHKKDGEHGKDHGEKDGKKDKEGGHEKGGHGDHGSESKGGKFIGAVTAVGKTAAWPAAGALAGTLYYSLISGGAVFLGPAIGFGAALGAGAWAIKKLWQIKNGKKGGDSGGHGAHH